MLDDFVIVLMLRGPDEQSNTTFKQAQEKMMQSGVAINTRGRRLFPE